MSPGLTRGLVRRLRASSARDSGLRRRYGEGIESPPIRLTAQALMLSCMTTPADLLFHAARFSLERLDWLASDMRRALGLGRLPCLPFLARWQLRQLTRSWPMPSHCCAA